MKQGQEISRDELQDQGWKVVCLLKEYEIWKKDGGYLLFDPEENIVLATDKSS
mgnify:CR=1 FL=1